MNSILISIVLTTIIFLTSCVLSTIILNAPKYKHYKRVYKNLPYMTFRLNIDHVHGACGFIWFTRSNDFCLERGIYIHSGSLSYFDPYTYYWFCKYRCWVNKNIDLQTIKNVTP